jgi:multiple sugar transport system ATP-binding protein
VLRDGVLQQCDAPGTLYHQPDNLFVAGFIGSPAMNLIALGNGGPLTLGGSTLALGAPGEAALADATGTITVGFRPEALQVGEGPLRAQIRTVEDLGSEVFVHLFLEHAGENVALVAKTSPPFDGRPGDKIGLQITGTTHLFAGDGVRVGSTSATFR